MANTNLSWPQCPFIDEQTKQPARPWLLWLQNPSVNSISTNTPLGAIYGGTDNDTTPEDGELLIGNGGTGYTINHLTQGPGMKIVNGSGTITLSALVTLTTGTYGSATQVPVFIVATDGSLTSVTNTAIAINANQVTAGTLAIAQGGTNAATAADARTNLGLGTMATQNVGINATIATAKLTGGGADGSMTFTNGILTSQTPAT